MQWQVTFEHPRSDYYVRVNNFCLLPSREIQLPTWQLKHPTLDDVFRPQNMVQGLKYHRDNILGFFENTLQVLTEKKIALPFPLGLIDVATEHRDPNCPKRYIFVSISSDTDPETETNLDNQPF